MGDFLPIPKTDDIKEITAWREAVRTALTKIPGGMEGSIDHGAISGLGDDDHTQYILVDGGRAFTDDQTFDKGLIVNTDDGIDYGDGTEENIAIATINVSGNPRFWWDEATDSFEMNKSLTLPGASLKLGNHVLSGNTETGDDGFEVIGTFHVEKHPDGTAASIEIHEGTEPVAPAMADAHRFWVDTDHNIQWQNQDGTSRMLHAAGGNAPGQWILNGTDIYYTAGNVGIGKIPTVALDVDGTIAATDGNSTNWNTSYGWGDHVGLYDSTGTASGLVSTHESTYNHPNYAIAYTHSQVAGGDSVHVSITENTNWDAAYTHVSNDGSNHGFINQSVTTSASPVFTALGIGITPIVDLHMRSSQIVIDNDTFPFATSKFNSQGVAWSAGQPARTPGLIFQAIAQDRPEISWYRGSRTYPEFSIRQHTTNDMGAEIYSGDGTSAPTMTMAFNLGNVGIGTVNPLGKFHIAPSWDNAEGIVLTTNGTNDNTGGYLQFRERGDNFYGAEFGYYGSGGSNRAYIGVRDNTTTLNEVISIKRSTGFVGIGTPTPQFLLDVNGDTRINGKLNVSSDLIVSTNVLFIDVSNGSINLGSAVTGTDRFNVFSPTTGVQTGIASFYDSSSNIKFRIRDEWTASSIPPRIESHSSLGFALNTTTDAPFIWYINGTGNEKMRLTSTGLGIGTITPGLSLEVRLDNGQQAMFFDSTAQAEGVGGGIVFGGKYTDAGAEAMAGKIGAQKTNSTSGHVGFDMVFKTQDFEGSITERMILTSDGLCGLHVPTISSPTKPLDVWGDTRLRGNLNVDVSLIVDNQITVTNIESSGNIVAGGGSSNFRISAYINRTTGIVRSARFQTDGNHVDARGISIWAGEDTESGTNYWLEAYDGNGGTLTGGLRSVAGVFDVFNACDERLKQNIEDTKIDAKSIINGLRVRDFELKRNPGYKVTDFIAQEALVIYPNAVGEPDPKTGMYGMSKTPLIPPIVKYIQELEMRITKLEET